MAHEYLIDKEIFDNIPELNTISKINLERTIKKNGCTTPIKVWNNFIIDGRSRYDICTKNNIEYNVEEVKVKDKKEARYLIIKSILSEKWVRRVPTNSFTKILILSDYVEEIRQSFIDKEEWTKLYDLLNDKKSIKKICLRFLLGDGQFLSKDNCQLMFSIINSKNEALIELIKNGKIGIHDAVKIIQSLKKTENNNETEDEEKEENYIKFSFIKNEITNEFRMNEANIERILNKISKPIANNRNKKELISMFESEYNTMVDIINKVFKRFSK